jgi:hypothetical protein
MGKVSKMQKGGSLGMKSVKAGYDNNPGVTRADIIVAAKKQAKKGAKIKKADNGTPVVPITRTPDLRGGQLRRLGRLSAKNPTKAKRKLSKMVERATREERGQQYLSKNAQKVMPNVPELRKGGKMKKARGGATLSPSKKSVSSNLGGYKRTIGKSMRNGGKMKMGGKCRGGCY